MRNLRFSSSSLHIDMLLYTTHHASLYTECAVANLALELRVVFAFRRAKRQQHSFASYSIRYANKADRQRSAICTQTMQLTG